MPTTTTETAFGAEHNEAPTFTFQIGQQYSARSLCDYDCVWTFTVTARTARFVTLRQEPSGETMRVGVYVYGDAERARPFGSYSMAPSICADRPAGM